MTFESEHFQALPVYMCVFVYVWVRRRTLVISHCLPLFFVAVTLVAALAMCALFLAELKYYMTIEVRAQESERCFFVFTFHV